MTRATKTVILKRYVYFSLFFAFLEISSILTSIEIIYTSHKLRIYGLFLCNCWQASQQVAKPHYDKKVQPGTLINKQVGNMYTASIYAAFASLIHNKNSSLVNILYGVFRFSRFYSKIAHYSVLFCIFFFKLITYSCLGYFQDGNRVMMFSYGSGLSATMFSLHLSEGKVPFSLSNIAKVMNVDEKLKRRTEVRFFLPVINLLT